ncbi:hypothetical protein B0H13DRAFT_2655277 [Mycena leptocephala]|nr:hypothetical protein B0H13DRAFT_2655277 [Mycena leptocephala]
MADNATIFTFRGPSPLEVLLPTQVWKTGQHVTNHLITVDDFPPTIFAVDHADEGRLVIKLLYADSIWKAIFDGTNRIYGRRLVLLISVLDALSRGRERLAALGRRPCICPAHAPPPPAPRSPDTLPPPAPASVPPPSLQSVRNPFTPFFLLSHPTPAPERLPAAVVRPELVETTQLYLKGPRAARIQHRSVLVLAARAQSQPVLGAGAEVGDLEGGEGGEVWGAGVCGGFFAMVGVWGGGESFILSVLMARAGRLSFMRIIPLASSFHPSLPSLSSPLPSSFGSSFVHTPHHPRLLRAQPSTAHFWIDDPHNHLHEEILFEPERVLVAVGVARLDGAIRLRLRIELFVKSNLGGSNARVCVHPLACID